MARPKNIAPTYRRHRDSARCWANGQWVNLGKWNSAESKAEFGRIVAQLAASPAATITTKVGAGLTVNQVLAAFWKHVEQHYRHPDGTPTSEQRWYRDSLKHVRRLYGHIVATEFGPLALKTVRQALIDDKLARKLVNARIARVKRAFKWAASEELIPIATFQALATVGGLRAGRTTAHETAPIGPADPAAVDAVLPFLNRHVRAMVELHRLTGMRPAELCAFRLADVDRTGEIWRYAPRHHKTLHHGKSRVVLIGPKGQAIVNEFIAGGTVLDPQAPLFSPRRAREERFAAMREKRKSSVQPSQLDRRVKNPDPKKLPAEAYTPNGYLIAIKKAARKAGVEPFAPNRLRHLFATEVRRDHGLEAAQVLLGHAKADVTQTYAERDMKLGTAVAKKIG